MKIKIDYKTGDSFGSHDETDHLEYDWNNLDIVKENIEAIVAHNRFNKELKSWDMSNEEQDELIKETAENWWFVKEHKYWGTNPFENYIYLKKDDGSIMEEPYSCFWTGYFEHLQYVSADLCLEYDANDY